MNILDEFDKTIELALSKLQEIATHRHLKEGEIKSLDTLMDTFIKLRSERATIYTHEHKKIGL